MRALCNYLTSSSTQLVKVEQGVTKPMFFLFLSILGCIHVASGGSNSDIKKCSGNGLYNIMNVLNTNELYTLKWLMPHFMSHAFYHSF